MKAGTRFALGAGVIVAGVALLIASGVKQTGQYFFTPTQLVQRVEADPSMHDVGLKVGAKVVPGSIRRDDG
jgi:cytochrome c-type biogenesis protein CcmE